MIMDNTLRHKGLSMFIAAPLASVRDGKLAVLHGEIACELTNWNNPGTLDTLAAAYAEAGDFENAVKWQGTAVAIFEGGSGQVPEDQVADFRGRLELYENGKPYREDPKQKSSDSASADSQPE